MIINSVTAFIVLGAIASIGLALMALFGLVYYSNVCTKMLKVLMFITGVITFCGAIGFLIYVWIVQNRHIGICYIRSNFSPILIALGFI